MKIFHPAVREWFTGAFPSPTRPQQLGWPAIAGGESTLILAPTGSGKTLAAFLWCLNRLMFTPPPAKASRCRVLYISPLKALAVDVERNLRAPLAGIANVARAQGVDVTIPEIAIRTGDTPALERSRFLRDAADILITTPESLFLLLTSNSRERLTTVDTVIIDEIHALVPGKRGAHLALSLERLEALSEGRTIQRIGLSATQRPLEEVARFLGGAGVNISRFRHQRKAASVLPLPVGARMSVESPPAMAGHPSCCGRVGDGNELLNHSRTAGWNSFIVHWALCIEHWALHNSNIWVMPEKASSMRNPASPSAWKNVNRNAARHVRRRRVPTRSRLGNSSRCA